MQTIDSEEGGPDAQIESVAWAGFMGENTATLLLRPPLGVARGLRHHVTNAPASDDPFPNTLAILFRSCAAATRAMLMGRFNVMSNPVG